MKTEWTKMIQSFDERRDIIIPGDTQKTLLFSTEHFLALGNEAINQHHFFAIALSGGATPKAIFEKLAQSPYRHQLDWSKVLLFWSDERNVPPTHSESNYTMAMDAGLKTLPLKHENIFRMVAEENIENHAIAYEKTIQDKLSFGNFDLVMLGMGEDGHTASLFPLTHGLHASNRLVIANFIPQKNCWRMTLTFKCINQAHHTVIYVTGQNKAKMVKEIFSSSHQPDILPIQRIGTPSHPALWILDNAAASELNQANT